MGVAALEGRLRDPKKIRIGFVRLFIGDVGTAFDKTVKFDVDAPPTGWKDLGATGDDTTVEATKEVFSLKTGLLRTTKFQAVIGLEGRINAILHEFDAYGINEALAGSTPFNILRTVPTASAISSVASKTAFTLASGQGANFAIGDRVVVDTLALHVSSINTSVVKTIAGDVITVDPALYVLPTTSMHVQKVLSRKLGAGTTLVPHRALLAVHDFGLGAGQICYHFPEVTAAESGFRPDFAGGRENVKLPLIFSAFGVTDADINDTVVFTIHDFD